VIYDLSDSDLGKSLPLPMELAKQSNLELELEKKKNLEGLPGWPLRATFNMFKTYDKPYPVY
jgi:hypothetical protein